MSFTWVSLGKISFDHLKKVGDQILESFKEVCCALGILADNEEWDNVVAEAIGSLSSKRARELFAVMLIYCEIPSPQAIFIKYLDVWVDDLRRRNYSLPERILKIYALKELETELQLLSRKLEDFNLPRVTQRDLDELDIATMHLERTQSALLLEETNFSLTELQEFVSLCKSSLPGSVHQSQRLVYDEVVRKFLTGEQVLAFVNARGGTGKIYLLNAILAFARSYRSVVSPALAVATSGIAATQLSNGRTFHSCFKAPLCILEHSVLDISVQTNLANLIRQSEIIVWDEAPMAHRFLLEALDRSLRDVMNNERPFGGKSLVLAGDFR